MFAIRIPLILLASAGLWAAEEAKPAAADAALAPPKGLRSVTPYIYVKDAKAAIAYYAKAFGAKPLYVVPNQDGTIEHAELLIGDGSIMLADEKPDQGMKSPATLGGSTGAIHLYVSDVDAVFKRAIDAGAQVLQPPMDAPWGHRFAMVTDPYGHVWSIATPKGTEAPEAAPVEDGFK
ncbi:MAG: VOC family protein [Planctomycetes bacterium]|nr:VOC family protein [Planctomycetota bacterium]